MDVWSHRRPLPSPLLYEPPIVGIQGTSDSSK